MKSYNNGENLIFLISQPRSGSTMLQLMLSGHQDIATTSEPWIALHPFYALKKGGLDARYDARLANNALKEFLTQSGLDNKFYKEQVALFLNSFYQKAISHQRKKFFLDKTPRYYLIIDELMESFPAARFIFLLRNPASVFNSIIKTWVKNDLKLLGFFKDDLLLAPKLIIDASKCYSAKSFILRYEDLVSDPKSVLEKICNYLGITYSYNMIDYGSRRSDWKFGDTVGIHKRSSPSSASIGSWENMLDSDQLNLLLQSYLKNLGEELVQAMGYNYSELIAAITKKTDNKEETNLWSSLINMSPHHYRERELLLKINLLNAEIEKLKKSNSWKITSPMRAIGDYIRRHLLI